MGANAASHARAGREPELREPDLGALRELFAHAKVFIATYALDATCTYVSDACRLILGLDPAEVIGKPSFDFVHPEDLPLVRAAHVEVLGATGRTTFTCRMLSRSGRWTWLECHGRLARHAGNSEILMIARDITERIVVEEQLRRSEERWQFALEGNGDGVWDWNVQTGEAFLSVRWKAMLGFRDDEIANHVDSWAELVHPDDRERVNRELLRHLRGETPEYASEHRLRCKDGTYRWILDRGKVLTWSAEGNPTRMVGTHTDITDHKRDDDEREKLETQLLQTQRLESLGVLAGGIAHDFNNLLTGILGHAELALMDLEPGAPLAARLEKVMTGARRAAELTNQLLAYSGQGAYMPRELSLAEVIEEMGHLLRVSISKKCTIEYAFAPDLPLIEADVSQLRQVVMNLILNASEAMGDKSGVIQVRAGTAEVTREELACAVLGRDLPPGHYAVFEVEDSGAGMAPATIERIFDPFFSTKFTGRGLGLAAVHGIVRSHRGAIRVESQLGVGSRFRVWLPLTRVAAQRPRLARGERDDWRAQGKVLLVDDEESVREVAGAMLADLGFTVITAQDGAQAVALVRERREGLALVLLDLTMPEKSGEEALAEIRNLAPRMPVLLMSGGGEERAARVARGDAHAGFLKKPFGIEELSAALREGLSHPTEKART